MWDFDIFHIKVEKLFNSWIHKSKNSAFCITINNQELSRLLSAASVAFSCFHWTKKIQLGKMIYIIIIKPQWFVSAKCYNNEIGKFSTVFFKSISVCLGSNVWGFLLQAESFTGILFHSSWQNWWNWLRFMDFFAYTSFKTCKLNL